MAQRCIIYEIIYEIISIHPHVTQPLQGLELGGWWRGGRVHAKMVFETGKLSTHKSVKPAIFNTLAEPAPKVKRLTRAKPASKSPEQRLELDDTARMEDVAALEGVGFPQDDGCGSQEESLTQHDLPEEPVVEQAQPEPSKKRARGE
jgi:hypothetical protein